MEASYLRATTSAVYGFSTMNHATGYETVTVLFKKIVMVLAETFGTAPCTHTPATFFCGVASTRRQADGLAAWAPAATIVSSV